VTAVAVIAVMAVLALAAGFATWLRGRDGML